MEKILRGATFSGVTTLVTYWLVIFITESLKENTVGEVLIALLITPPLLFIAGFVTAFILLLPLYKVYKTIRKKYSFILFILVGIGIAACPVIFIHSTPIHDKPAALFTDVGIRMLFVMSFIGSTSAAAAWYGLGDYNLLNKFKSNKTRDQIAGTRGATD